MGVKKPAATAKKKSARSAKAPLAPPVQASPADPEKNLGGRPPLEWNDAIYRQVDAMIGYGLTVEQASSVVGLSKKTLERRLSEKSAELGFDALEHARAKVITNLAQSGYKQAVGYKRLELDSKGRAVEVDVPPNGKMTQYMLNVLGGAQYVPKRSLDLTTGGDGRFEVHVVDYRVPEKK